MSKIIKVKSRQVYDSRGNPTVEAEVYTSSSSANFKVLSFIGKSNANV